MDSSYMKLLLLTLAGLLICTSGWTEGQSSGPDFERLASAIYRAEGGAKTSHPYGIMARYRHTTPRQACINTIKHKYKDWIAQGSYGDFLTYLASKYAPINSDTDNGTNRYWLKNVRYLLANQI